MAKSEPFASSVQSAQPCHHFEFPEILLATENFAESLVIGSGGFGNVYKGNLIYGSSLFVAAIKRLDSMSNQGAAEFWAEVEMLSRLRHCNLVSLIGYCNYEKEMILVYEYMHNGTLDDHLHKLRTPLSWLQRLNICIGASRGLHYLHTGTGITSGIIHRDVKSSNILLHESWAAKISDFGLSKIGPTNQPSTYVNTLIKGTFGYLDPNYFTTGKLTRKSDVYAFGVVLLEVLCRKRAVDRSLDEEEWGLVTWVQDSIKDGNLKRIIDSDVRDEISPKCLKEFVSIAERCLHNSPRQRPTMAEVLVGLESVLVLQEKFNKSLQATSRTILSRMVNVLPFISKGENSGDSKFSSKSKGNNGIAHFQSPSPNLKVFKFSDLEKSTRKFSLDLLLGEGGFGKVFLGWVEENTLAPSKQGVGIPVAVKRLKQKSSQGPAQWLAEVNFLGHMDHRNIVRLLGYCKDESEHLLVYEYMPNRSFDRFLFTDIAKRLSWGTRLLIMIGVARGLTYLHSENVMCRGLKSGDILLDEDYNAKLGDFGLVKYGPETGETHVTTRVMGTYGYAAPEYILTGHLTTKSDIYGYGIVLLVSITGRRAMDVRRREGQQSLVDWASSIQSNRKNLKEIMDPRLEHNYPLQGAFECVALALRCVANKPKDRPSSEEVLQNLEQIYAHYK
ncbi:putative transferase, protein kinase RLK-Pelle-RLCK-VIIa-2 family [Helianthus annuus]|uniref:non-specific serine/threonine protein kinase n=1 Tax=Helianthus annuus TaxID=4232 RepID=A0A9K3NQG2_HELAN|nr:probable serine/threonine-protein kinase PIX7 [Helianthus annuus]KAF5808145.1 putative transferase, protein kinase RLK-Pelle-RLCK-VIIa-2 family [Helianthus annuus]KAJ0579445.1 putative transferase, protein kinase RLK-Pelle-RLCK-VIIa-2 family [Helianthus annuus]KAJ0595331.1 putative transferase, protein kinase RLK-Pelle-RLCK-VIIa-2 family [Helianthus annuus]